jgi:hypothetical protein
MGGGAGGGGSTAESRSSKRPSTHSVQSAGPQGMLPSGFCSWSRRLQCLSCLWRASCVGINAWPACPPFWGGEGGGEWDTGRMIRRIEVGAKAVTWNDEGCLVAIASEEAFYVLRFNRDAVAGADAAALASEEGIEAAFELQHEVSDKVQGGVWVGDCFVYTNAALRGRGGHHPGAP